MLGVRWKVKGASFGTPSLFENYVAVFQEFLDVALPKFVPCRASKTRVVFGKLYAISLNTLV